jgi:geranylgeranyl diphosphate synthase, type II
MTGLRETAGQPAALKDYLAAEVRRIDEALDRLTPAESAPPETIHRAMRYSLFAGGKRIRPILCLASAAAVSDAARGAVEAGCALEMIHTYSLIHDDLPALDNDDFRRGKPTNHKVFGEAMAILAGDALFTLAMQTLVRIEGLGAASKLALLEELSFGAGTVDGMIGGQVFDIEGEHQPPTAELLDRIHRAKTGALLRASVRMGGICGGASAAQLDALSRYGDHVGLAFQIVDDILDVEESTESLGKTAGKDAAQGKITFPAVYGLEESRAMAHSECARAHEALEIFGVRARRLDEIADLIVHRKS